LLGTLRSDIGLWLFVSASSSFLYTGIKRTFFQSVKVSSHFKAINWKSFFQKLCLCVHLGAVSLIHFTLQRNAATLRKVLAPFSFSHVIDYSLSLSFFFVVLDFMAIRG